MRLLSLSVLLLLALGTGAAERRFDYAETPAGKLPPGFRSTVTGSGKPGEWKVVLDAEAPLLPPLSPQATPVTKKPVLAQLSRDPTDDHYPLLIHEAEVFRDFTRAGVTLYTFSGTPTEAGYDLSRTTWTALDQFDIRSST